MEGNIMKAIRALPYVLLLSALAAASCEQPTPTDQVLNSGQPQAAVQVSPIVPKTELALWGAPQVAPAGTQRTLHVTTYTAAYDAGWPAGVSSVNLTADGNAIGRLSFDPQQPLAAGNLDWMPPDQGPAGGAVEYTIQATADGVSPRQTTLCVTYPNLTIDYLHQISEASCEPVSKSTGPTVPSIVAADAAVDYADCTGAGVIFAIHTSDPDHNIVYAFMQVNNIALMGGGHSDGSLNTDPRENFLFYEEWPASSLTAQFPGGDISISWTAKIAWAAGPPPAEAHIVSSGPQIFHLSLPICAKAPSNVAPVQPGMPHFPGLTPTQTAGNCPPGSYFADVARKCIQIEIPGENNSRRQAEKGKCPSGQSWVCTENGILVTCGCE
jgi:hypothetical protein